MTLLQPLVQPLQRRPVVRVHIGRGVCMSTTYAGGKKNKRGGKKNKRGGKK